MNTTRLGTEQLAFAVWLGLLAVGAPYATALCVQTTITPPGQGPHAAIALTDPAGEQTATFDLVWGGMLASLKYNGVEQVFGAHTIGMVQPTMFAYFGPNQYSPFGAGDYALRGSNVPGVYCANGNKVFLLTGMTDFAAGASGNTPLGAVQDGAPVPGKFAVPYTLTTVARFVHNRTSQPQYYLRLEQQLANNHPSESLPFGFWLKGSIPTDHSFSALAPAACLEQTSTCTSSQIPYLLGGLYTDAALTNGVAFYTSPQTFWSSGSQAFISFGTSSSPSFRSASLVNTPWAVAPLTARGWSWYALAGPWNTALSFAQAGGPAPEYEGNLDGANCWTIAGWAWNANLPNTPINVTIYDGPTAIATVTAATFRQDLLNLGIGNGAHGFSYTVPSSLRTGTPHTISATFEATTTSLPNSPLSINCPVLNRSDFNGDAKNDIVWQNRVNAQASVWLMNGTTVAGVASLPTASDPNWRFVGTADFNGDGKTDLLLRNQSTGENIIWLMSGTSYVAGVTLPSQPDLNWVIAGTGDFNGDGQPDIVWQNHVTGQASVWFMSGTTVSGVASLPTASDANYWFVGTGDFNGDGQTDIVLRHQVTGANLVWYMNGTSYAGGASLPTQSDLGWKIVGTADFDGDGKPDLVWRNDSSGQNVFWIVVGTTVTSVISFSTQPDTTWEIRGPR